MELERHFDPHATHHRDLIASFLPLQVASLQKSANCLVQAPRTWRQAVNPRLGKHVLRQLESDPW
eukprot:7368417-Pyramimonas_sp.AAC.1